MKTELELGHCLRLPAEGPCECDLYLTCAKFVTTPQYAPRLRERLCLEGQLPATRRNAAGNARPTAAGAPRSRRRQPAYRTRRTRRLAGRHVLIRPGRLHWLRRFHLAPP